MTEPTTDGRLAKGERRKQELIEATLRVVARDGVAGVSHRAVAAEADLPPTAAAYHFKRIDDLLTGALTLCMDEAAERMRRLAAATDGSLDDLRAMARLMARVARDPAMLRAEYELFLLAARRPELRPPAQRWLTALADFARCYTSSPVRVQVLLGTVDGLLLQALLTDRPPSADDYEAVLREVLRPDH
ncbi:TetR/AcrR family transcriptional regulator [Conexibacter woesei]|uniref:Transcriptional regulator, TetR family n=1 Tax=Conexibacter woesei (strain DSM 14684 / CCUG 47730 / CIP 108061 / JCM 11494 / NBRC 100937 / ID131577) TaxID=469383 RepID=D3FDB8_CONWI|nr:TetR family transcriptional regulator [Conexibacter woesei]ADB53510.1 transcriptional regulator, TetR family [Conexibacter woesei DSM 14684]